MEACVWNDAKSANSFGKHEQNAFIKRTFSCRVWKYLEKVVFCENVGNAEKETIGNAENLIYLLQLDKQR